MVINGDTYQFMDIELYYKGLYSADKHTHQHNFPHGLFRAHAAGIDLTLRESEQHFGGVLIKKVCKNDIIKSLQKPGSGVKWEKGVSILKNDIVPTHRVNLGTGDDATRDKPWRFVLKDPLYINKMPGKEKFVGDHAGHFQSENIGLFVGYRIDL